MDQSKANDQFFQNLRHALRVDDFALFHQLWEEVEVDEDGWTQAIARLLTETTPADWPAGSEPTYLDEMIHLIDSDSRWWPQVSAALKQWCTAPDWRARSGLADFALVTLSYKEPHIVFLRWAVHELDRCADVELSKQLKWKIRSTCGSMTKGIGFGLQYELCFDALVAYAGAGNTKILSDEIERIHPVVERTKVGSLLPEPCSSEFENPAT